MEDTNNELEPTNEFALEFYSIFSKQITKTFPGNLSIQADALLRLRQDFIWDEEPFMVYEYGTRQKDQDLPFCVLFYGTFFVVELYGGIAYSFSFGEFESPAVLLDQIMILINALLSRQIVLLASLNNSQVYATEVVLVHEKDSKPHVIDYGASFPWFKNKGNEVRAYYNTALEDSLNVPDDFFMYKKENGKWPVRGRNINNLSPHPLSKRESEESTKRALYQQSSIKAEENPLLYIVKTGLFWAIFVFLLAINRFFIPVDYGVIYFTITGNITFFLILPRIVKHYKKRPLLERIYLRIPIPKLLRERDIGFYLSLSFLACLPLKDSYIKNTTQPISYLQSAIENNLLFIPILSALIMLIIFAIYSKRRANALKLSIVLFTIVSYLVLQVPFINQDEAPVGFEADIATWTGVLSILFLIGIPVVRLYKNRHKSRTLISNV